MTLVQATLCMIDGEWYTADIIVPEPAAKDSVASLVPGTLKPVDLDSMALTAEQRRKVEKKLAELESRINPRE
jgi:hypothetical protein